MREQSGVSDWEVFATTVWSLWNNRNAVRHSGQGKQGRVIATEAQRYIEEFRAHIPSDPPKINPPPKKWSPPPLNWYKVNVDDAVFRDQGGIGVGVVIRSDQGGVMGSMSKKIHLPWGAIEAEAKAMKEGILLAWDLGLKNIIVEGDSLVVVQALNGIIAPAISIQKVIEGITWCLKRLDTWKISHSRRSSNTTAHLMAKEASSILENVIWVEDTPPPIANQLLYDVMSMDLCPS